MISILYVDDEPLLLELGKMFLERNNNVSVTTLHSASAAISLLKTEKFDTIISDYQMPGMNGIEFLKTVRTHYGDIPFILFTGRGREEVVIDAINNGADFYLQKGGPPEAQFVELHHKIMQAIHRKDTDDALRESEEKYRLVVENSHDAIYIYRNNELLFANNRCSDLTGFTYDELMSMNIWDLVHPDDRARMQQSGTVRMSGTDLPPTFSGRIITKSGDIRDCEFFVTVILFQNAPAILGIIRDITEKKKYEEAKLEIEAKRRLIAENKHYIIWTTDENLRITYISPSVEVLRGLTPEEAMSESISDALTYESYQAFLNYYHLWQDADKNGSTIPNNKIIELEFRCRDGSTLWTETVITPLIEKNKESTGFVCLTRDITQKKQTEEMLRKNQYLLSEAMNMANLGEWEYDVIPDMFTFDDRFFALYGTTAEREGGYQMSAGEYAMRFIPPEERGLVRMEVEKALNATDPHFMSYMEHHIIRRDGEIRNIIVRFGITKDAEGRTIKTHGANQDITERKKAEDALLQANRELNLLTGITRHDILNNISTIFVLLDAAKMVCSDPAVSDYLVHIESAVHAIQSQTEFTRVYQNSCQREAQWMLLDTVLSCSHFPASITFISDVQGIFVFADPMLDTVFSNLLHHSIRHNQQVTMIRVSSLQREEDLVLVWEDNGPGIAPDEKEIIFEREYAKNTGLGMFLVRDILSLTGITIKETGIYGTGARFEITVPKGKFRVET